MNIWDGTCKKIVNNPDLDWNWEFFLKIKYQKDGTRERIAKKNISEETQNARKKNYIK